MQERLWAPGMLARRSARFVRPCAVAVSASWFERIVLRADGGTACRRTEQPGFISVDVRDALDATAESLFEKCDGGIHRG